MPPKAAAAKPKSSSDHASYQDMIKDAIITLKDRQGSSRMALKKYIKANNKNLAEDKMFDSLFNRALKAGVAKGVFEQPKGPSGGTKLGKTQPKAATKPAAAKTEKKPAAATTVKKTTAKKPAAATAAKKTAATKPKTATKAAPKPKAAAAKSKAAAKPKAATKKTTTKSAPAVSDKPAVLGKTKSGRVTKTTSASTTKKPAAKKAAPKKTAA